jgi:osmoprotectant transport system permease protein
MPQGLPRQIADLTLEHLYLVAISTAIATLLGASLGVLLVGRPAPRRWALAAVNVIQTVPSLALFGFLIPIPLIGGIGPRTAIVALVLYARCCRSCNTTAASSALTRRSAKRRSRRG